MDYKGTRSVMKDGSAESAGTCLEPQALRRHRQTDREFKFILGFVESLRQQWVIVKLASERKIQTGTTTNRRLFSVRCTFYRLASFRCQIFVH